MYNGATIRAEMLKYYVQSYNVCDGTSLIYIGVYIIILSQALVLMGLASFHTKLMTHQLWYFYTFPTKYAEVWPRLVSSDRNVAIVSNLFTDITIGKAHNSFGYVRLEEQHL